jgi:hypothetical protein
MEERTKNDTSNYLKNHPKFFLSKNKVIYDSLEDYHSLRYIFSNHLEIVAYEDPSKSSSKKSTSINLEIQILE